jgi:prolipoprotein diacylglyceryltransferase
MLDLSIEFGLFITAFITFWVLRWAFVHLPGEHWQFAAVLPIGKADGDEWQGVNITYYGVICALAYSVALATFVFLSAAAQQPLAPTFAAIAALLLIGVPASKWVAKRVEGKSATFTVGGAMFVSMIAVVPVVTIVNLFAQRWGGERIDPLIFLAASSCAYVVGEALGRLGCLSFGCCYGKCVSDATSLERALYGKTATVYRGKLKKIAYASDLEGEPVIAVQSIASCVLICLFLVSVWLFWNRTFGAALLVAMGGAQLWRLYSETLRADYRGGGAINVYQWMALGCIAGVVMMIFVLPQPTQVRLSASSGLRTLIQLETVLAIQAVAIVIILLMGKSQVTGAKIALSLKRDVI